MLIFREVKALVERQEVEVEVDVDGEPGSFISACREGQVRSVLHSGSSAYFVHWCRVQPVQSTRGAPKSVSGLVGAV